MKPGRVVILLAGRHAGKKAIIVKQNDEGKKVRPSPTAFSVLKRAFRGIGQKVRSRLGRWN
jgi:ribosomal protein L14E/L6E/L27E